MKRKPLPQPPTPAELEAQAEKCEELGLKTKAAMLRRVAAALKTQEEKQ